MLLMCHIFIGALIGLVAFRYVKDRKVVVLTMIGSMLPDLIDKPLGHIILQGSIDYGRIYAHSGLFLIAIVILGIAYQKKSGSWIMMGVALGVLSHLALDSMWELPVTVFYPLLGDFGLHYFPNYIAESLAKEFGSVYEWFFGASVLAMLLFIFPDKLRVAGKKAIGDVPLISRSLALTLIAIGMLSIACAASSSYNPLSGENDVEQNLIIGLAAAAGGALSYYLWTYGVSSMRTALGRINKT
jgi:membrane-bound metal-dependent hydrolase YbcI (DUF457 family)